MPTPSYEAIFRLLISPDRPFHRFSTTFCLRLWLTAKSTGGEPASMPKSLAWATWRLTDAVSRNDLAGMHPRCRQVPPTLSFSTNATDIPADAA